MALVGQSGCGKSTLLQLVQRFYDTDNSSETDNNDVGIFMDGINIKNLAPSWIRSQIGVVFQTSDLFDTTIHDNIAFGQCTRDIPMDEIIEAAKIANIHDFILSLPQVS